jgi:hypothetical protein
LTIVVYHSRNAFRAPRKRNDHVAASAFINVHPEVANSIKNTAIMQLKRAAPLFQRIVEFRKQVAVGDASRHEAGSSAKHLAVLRPLILPTDLVLLLGSKVIRDVERLADLLGRLALNHVGDSLAADVEEGLDVEVVGGLRGSQLVSMYRDIGEDERVRTTYKNDFKKHLLVDLHELLVPLVDVGGLLSRVGVVVCGGGRVVLVVLAPFDDFLEDRFVDLLRG